MARPSNYLGANLTLQDTFSSVIERSNDIAYDLGTIVVTTAPVPQANTTNGALTSGNAHVQGFFSANTLIASDELRGGSHDTPAELLVTSNTHFTGDRVYTSDTTIADFGANVTFSADTANNLTNHFVIDFGNTHITQGELRVSGNTVFDNATAVVDIDTNLVDITANVQVQSTFVSMNVDTVTIGSDATDDLSVNSNTIFNSDVLVGVDATTLLEINSNTVINNSVLIGEDESDLLEINANTVINNDAYIGSDGTDQLTVNSTSTFNNNVTLGSGGTDTLTVNADSDFNANVNIDGVLTTTNNVVLGSDGTDTFTVNADSDFNANVNIDGVLTATNNATLGSDGTDTLTVNAVSDFNANVNVDGVLTATNNVTIGSDGTDTLIVNAGTNLNANVTIGDAEADALDVNSTVTFNNGVTIGSDETDDLLVNSNTGFVNDVTIGVGGIGTDTLTVNADSDFNANVNVDGVFSVTNNATIGSDATDQFTVNANTGFENDVTIGTDSADSFTVQSTATFNNNLIVGSDASDQFTVNANTGFENGVTIGVDGTDILTVNAVSDFNANVSIDGELVVGNNVTIGVSSSDTLTVQSNTSFNHDVTIGNSDVDTLTINADLASDVIPTANTLYNLGRTDARWAEFFADNATVTANTTTQTAIIRNTAPVLVGKNSSTGYPELTISLDANNGNTSNVVSFSTTAVLPQTSSIALGSPSTEFSSAYFATDTYITSSDVQFTSVQMTIDGDQLDITSNTGIANDFTVTGDTTLTEMIVTGNSDILGHASVSQTLSITGETSFSSNTTVAATHLPAANSTYDLGAAGAYFNDIYVDNFVSPNFKITSLNDTPTSVPGTGEVLVANSTGGFEYSSVATKVTELTDTPTTVTDGSVLVGNTTNGFEYSAYIDRLVDLVDVLDNSPANSHVLAYIEDSGGFEFRSPQSLSEDFSLTLDDLTDVDATAVAADHVIVANTTLQWESKKLEFNLITDVNTTSSTGDILVANSTGGFEFTSPSNLSVELADLTDVSTVGAANSEVLTYIAATDTFEFTAYGWVLGNSQNATTGETITNAENLNIYGGSNITVSVGTGPLGQTNVQISQDEIVLGVNDLTDAVSYDGGISIGVGTGALVNDDDTVNYNTAFGYEALNFVTTGTGNLGVGANAGDNIVNGFNNTVIGRGARASASDASNEITLGNNSVTDFRIPGIGLTANTTAIEFSGDTIATQSYVSTSVSSAIDNLIDSAPGTLDTLNELAEALGDDPNFATTVTNSLATKATLDADVSFANVAVETLTANTISTTSAVVGQTITSTAGLLNLNGWEIDANLFDTTQTVIYADATHQFVGNVEIGDTLDVSNNTTIDGNLVVTRDIQMDTANVVSMTANTLVVSQPIDGQVDSISNHTTTALLEGDNLYYTVARANTAIDARVDKTFVDALNVDAATLDGANGTFYLDYNNFTNTPTIPQSGVDFDPAGTDNSTNVTLTGLYDYLTITGQQITLNQIDYTTDISNLPTLYTTADANNDIDARVTKSFVDALNVDADTLDGANSTFYLDYDNFTGTPYIPQSTVDFDPVGTDNSTDVTLAGVYDYLTITGQQITLNQIDYTTDISNLPTLYTTADANNDIDARVDKTFVDALNVDADTLDGADSTVFLRNDQSGTVNGDLTVTGNIEATDFNSTSDARIKQNVETVDMALDKVCSMRGVYYNRIGEVEQQVGVIAQEVESIIPEVVHTNSNDLKTVSYGNLVGVLIEAIKDLKAEVDDLKKNQ